MKTGYQVRIWIDGAVKYMCSLSEMANVQDDIIRCPHTFRSHKQAKFYYHAWAKRHPEEAEMCSYTIDEYEQ